MEQVVEEYVYKRYRQYKDKPLIIQEFDSFFTIKVNKDESPLILGKKVIYDQLNKTR